MLRKKVPRCNFGEANFTPKGSGFLGFPPKNLDQHSQESGISRPAFLPAYARHRRGIQRVRQMKASLLGAFPPWNGDIIALEQ
ncbi:MAG: hypothetical protein AB1589_05985 [Cyanobacteriota bacterium]